MKIVVVAIFLPKNEYAFSLVNTAVKVALPAFAAERPPLSIVISCLHGAQQQVRRCCGQAMGQTD